MTGKLLSILLCALLAVPSLSIGAPARLPTPHAAATTAIPHLPDAAFRAGESVSRVVFSADLERNGADAAVPQSATELREICFADAERALQECQEAGRANCSGVYEQDRRVCVTRYPYPVEDGTNPVLGGLAAVVVGLGLVWLLVALDDEETVDIY